MRKKSRSRINHSKPTKLDARSAGKADIEMGRRIRLRRVALNVSGKELEVESLLFLDSAFSLRLLRAYTSIKDQTVQRQFVSLVEMIADSQGQARSKKPSPG